MDSKALLLVGSARRPRSTSEALGTYLCERLGESGFETETLLLHRNQPALLDAVDRADILLLACPLYADSLPYLVVEALERIAQHRLENARARGQRMAAIVNSGFPETQHNDLAIAICRQFAREAGFEWVGGLALGGGPVLNGRSPKEAGGMARHALESLDLAAAALAEGRPLPQEALQAMARPMMPARMYTTVGNVGWRWQAWRNRVWRMGQRP